MLHINVFVPEVKGDYSISVNEELKVLDLKKQLCALVDKGYMLFDCEGMNQIEDNNSLKKAGIVNGSRLIMLKFNKKNQKTEG